MGWLPNRLPAAGGLGHLLARQLVTAGEAAAVRAGRCTGGAARGVITC